MTIRLMPPVSSDAPIQGSPKSGDRLESWKEIANYLRREVRTAQLWEKKEGMPVHRHFHKRLGSVYAFRSEIDEWRRRVSEKACELAVVESRRGKTPNSDKARVALYISPLQLIEICDKCRGLGEEFADATIAALEQFGSTRLNIQRTSLANGDVPLGSLSGESSDIESRQYVLQWSIQHAGDGLRLEATLLAANERNTVWSSVQEVASADFTEMAGRLSAQIVRCLWLLCLPSPSVVPRREARREARESYLKGRYFWNQRNEEALRKAVRYFDSAIQADPTFALSYSGLADALTLLSFYEIVPPAEAMPSARRAALKAIELAPDSAEAHASLADVLLHFDRNWQGADQEYRRSLECNPDYALGYHWYSNLLAARGQHDAAHLAIMQALEIDPVSIITQVWAGVTSHLAHNFDEAIRHYQSALELDPDFVWAHMYMAQALEQTGNFKQAQREFDTAIQLSGGSYCVRAMQAHAYAAAGNRSQALQILHGVKSGSTQATPSYDIAAAYAALGESRQMVAWLRRACKERNMKLFILTQDPRFDSFRQRAEFKEIVTQIGLLEPTLPNLAGLPA